MPTAKFDSMNYGSKVSSPKSVLQALKLDNFDVFISMLKFTIGLGIFSRPYMYKQFGPNNAVVVDVIICIITIISNINLVNCMNIMPAHMVEPESNLTYGGVVKYIMDDRNVRLDNNKKSFWSQTLDIVIFASQLLNLSIYSKYITE